MNPGVRILKLHLQNLRLWMRWLAVSTCTLGWAGSLQGQTFKPLPTLEQQLKAAPRDRLVEDVVTRGNPARGAVLFFRSAAACSQCHASGRGPSPLGPNLADLRSPSDETPPTRAYLLDALLHPSQDLRPGFETISVRTLDGHIHTGIIEEQDGDDIVLRSPSDLARSIRIPRSEIEGQMQPKQSLMPDGWIAALREQRDFLDLAAYVFAVGQGGLEQADKWAPSPEQLAIREDWVNLDHAGILQKLKAKDFESGKAIYQGYCVDCHGPDGNRPNLPTARAFGTQPLKFGSDPYQMFMTLTRGNGLMGSMSHLTPHQRYEVIHYIRQQFMKSTNPDYRNVTQEYLQQLPKGTEDGTAVTQVQRDFGPALASQLNRNLPSVLTTRVGSLTVAHDLHTMNAAGIWEGGFLDLRDTQHALARGEGVALPGGKPVPGWQGWEWGHDGTMDYPRESKLPRGPLPANWMTYHGHYMHGTQVLLGYAIDGREVLDLASSHSDPSMLRRRLDLGPGKELVLAVAQDTKSQSKWSLLNRSSGLVVESIGPAGDTLATTTSPAQAGALAAALLGQSGGFRWECDSPGRLLLRIPASSQSRLVEIVVARLPNSNDLAAFRQRLAQEEKQPRLTEPLTQLTKGGPSRWPEEFTTTGYLGLDSSAYVLDTLTIPESTPWNTWFRTTALDFLSDGRMVVCMYGGDVWIVSGIDAELRKLRWKRFAAGLFEPLGLKVVKDQIYLTCRDRIVRLHDFNGDQEADFYESFSTDTDVSTHFHAFHFDLQTDDQGNFYYAKGGHGADLALPGAIIRVSPDGRSRQVMCTGFRVPNGMGTLPGGRLTCSDNQGQWMPASKINLLKQGGYYGWVPTYNSPGKWSADGGKIDIKSIVPPTSFDRPLVWMPHEFDNSSGGQVWVDDPRWGPLSGRLLHTSFGKGWLSYLMIQEVDQLAQAAIVKLPFDFRTGIMRGRVNPHDGQVYVVGLQGWNGSGRIGLMDEGIQRLRYTGQPYKMITQATVQREGLRVEFSFPVDPASAKAQDAFQASHWNYRWQAAYGSEKYAPTDGKIGAEALTMETVELAADGKSVLLRPRELQPVDQLHLRIKLLAQDGAAFTDEVFWTIHRIP